jgi:hypothetical protein
MSIVIFGTHTPYEAPSGFVLERLEELNSRVLSEAELREYCALMSKMIDPETGEYTSS